MLVTKGKVGKLWAHSGRKWESQDLENAEVLNTLPQFHQEVLSPRTIQCWRDEAGDHPSNLKVPKAVGLDKMHLWVMRELSGELAKPLFIVFENSWQSGGL